MRFEAMEHGDVIEFLRAKLEFTRRSHMHLQVIYQKGYLPGRCSLSVVF